MAKKQKTRHDEFFQKSLTPYKNQKSFEAMIEQAKEAIELSSSTSEIYIGCDSQRHKAKGGVFKATYSVVIVLHIDGRHGCKLFHFSETLPDYGSLKQRLLNEATYAIRAGSEIADIVGARPFAIHLDINKSPNHKSNVALKEASGYVMGTLGFAPIFKPDAWASSTAADHIVRH